MLYVTPQCSELTVTIAILLMMGALPKMTTYVFVLFNLECYVYVHMYVAIVNLYIIMCKRIKGT